MPYELLYGLAPKYCPSLLCKGQMKADSVGGLAKCLVCYLMKRETDNPAVFFPPLSHMERWQLFLYPSALPPRSSSGTWCARWGQVQDRLACTLCHSWRALSRTSRCLQNTCQIELLNLLGSDTLFFPRSFVWIFFLLVLNCGLCLFFPFSL